MDKPISLIYIFTLALWISWAPGSACFAASPGAAAAPFLKIGQGARPAGMGEAFVGLANDVNAAYWNPAGLTQIGHHEETFMHNVWFESMSSEYLALAHRLNGRKVIGGSLTYLSSIGFDKTDKNGNLVGSYNNNDLAAAFSYAQRIKTKASLGASVKLVKEKIEDESAMALALDLGALYQVGKFQFGGVIQNAGTKIQFKNESQSLPLTIRAGAAYLFRKPLILAMDMQMPSDGKPGFNLGCEYIYRSMVVGRLGYKMTGSNDLGGQSGISIGIGFQSSQWGMDYAWSPYGLLGVTHRLSLIRKLGGVEAPKSKETKKESEKGREAKPAERTSLKKHELLANAFKACGNQDYKKSTLIFGIVLQLDPRDPAALGGMKQCGKMMEESKGQKDKGKLKENRDLLKGLIKSEKWPEVLAVLSSASATSAGYESRTSTEVLPVEDASLKDFEPGLAFYKTGNYQKAVDFFEYYLLVHPADKKAKEWLHKISSEQKSEGGAR